MGDVSTITIRRGPVCLLVDMPRAMSREVFEALMRANDATRELADALERDAASRADSE